MRHACASSSQRHSVIPSEERKYGDVLKMIVCVYVFSLYFLDLFF